MWLKGTLADAPWAQIEEFAPQVCVHAAWITTPGYLESPQNEQFVEWSLAFLRRLATTGVKHLVVLGTCIEYELGPRVLSETETHIAPDTTYARCKDALHAGLIRTLGGSGARLCWARVFYPFGIGERPDRLCSSVALRLLRGEEVVLRTPFSTKDWIYIDDLARALVAVVENGFQGAINLGTGCGTTVSEIARTIGRILGKLDLIQESPQAAPDPFDYVVADVRKLSALGWKPEVSLDAGLRLLVNHLKSSQ